jgi:hypothetical protein
VVAHLRVRLVSRSFRDGAYYNVKGVVQDVMLRAVADNDDRVGHKRTRPAVEELRATVRLDTPPHAIVTGASGARAWAVAAR